MRRMLATTLLLAAGCALEVPPGDALPVALASPDDTLAGSYDTLRNELRLRPEVHDAIVDAGWADEHLHIRWQGGTTMPVWTDEAVPVPEPSAMFLPFEVVGATPDDDVVLYVLELRSTREPVASAGRIPRPPTR